MVLARHPTLVEKRIGRLKTRATQQLIADGLHPFVGLEDSNGKLPPIWARRGWKVFLDSDNDVIRAIDYVNENPEKEGKPRQTWSFVAPYIGAG